MQHSWTEGHARPGKGAIGKEEPQVPRYPERGITQAGVESYLVALGFVLAAIVWTWVMSVG